MSSSVADQVFAQVQAVCTDEGVSRAEAIRRVAARTGRSPSAVSSAYYSGSRRARATPAPRTGRPAGRRSGRTGVHSDAPALFEEMLPLVEAGATVEQAARRFGDDDESAADIAAGFSRWIARGGGPRGDGAAATAAAPDPRLKELERELKDAQGRITALEADNRGLRRDLTRARQAITRVRSILDSTTAG
jgi:hypothetical protein